MISQLLNGVAKLPICGPREDLGTGRANVEQHRGPKPVNWGRTKRVWEMIGYSKVTSERSISHIHPEFPVLGVSLSLANILHPPHKTSSNTTHFYQTAVRSKMVYKVRSMSHR